MAERGRQRGVQRPRVLRVRPSPLCAPVDPAGAIDPGGRDAPRVPAAECEYSVRSRSHWPGEKGGRAESSKYDQFGSFFSDSVWDRKT
jgi:hypothetical protein